MMVSICLSPMDLQCGPHLLDRGKSMPFVEILDECVTAMVFALEEIFHHERAVRCCYVVIAIENIN